MSNSKLGVGKYLGTEANSGIIFTGSHCYFCDCTVICHAVEPVINSLTNVYSDSGSIIHRRFREFRS